MARTVSAAVVVFLALVLVRQVYPDQTAQVGFLGQPMATAGQFSLLTAFAGFIVVYRLWPKLGQHLSEIIAGFDRSVPEGVEELFELLREFPELISEFREVLPRLAEIFGDGFDLSDIPKLIALLKTVEEQNRQIIQMGEVPK